MGKDKDDFKPKLVPKLAEIKEFKKKPEVSIADTLRQVADKVDAGVLGEVDGFVTVVDSSDYGIVLVGPSSYSHTALMLQAALHANVEDYLYGGEDEE